MRCLFVDVWWLTAVGFDGTMANHFFMWRDELQNIWGCSSNIFTIYRCGPRLSTKKAMVLLAVCDQSWLVRDPQRWISESQNWDLGWFCCSDLRKIELKRSSCKIATLQLKYFPKPTSLLNTKQILATRLKPALWIASGSYSFPNLEAGVKKKGGDPFIRFNSTFRQAWQVITKHFAFY